MFKIAENKNMIDSFLEESIILIDLFKKYPEYITLINNININKNLRKELITKAFAKSFNISFLNFFYLLIDRNFFSQLNYILKRFIVLCNESKNIIFGTVLSVRALTKNQVEVLSQKISNKLKKNIHLTNKIDQTLIAGIKIKVLNQIFDGSIKGQLNDMKTQIKKMDNEVK